MYGGWRRLRLLLLAIELRHGLPHNLEVPLCVRLSLSRLGGLSNFFARTRLVFLEH